MSTKDIFTALPDRPLTIAEVKTLERQDEIEYTAPLLGLADDRDPRENVVGMYLGLNNRGNLLGYATTPGGTWNRIAVLNLSVPSTTSTKEAFDKLVGWIEQHTPGHEIAILEKGQPPR
jgi:hypothetical protein